jgi:hypothetical protein
VLSAEAPGGSVSKGWSLKSVKITMCWRKWVLFVSFVLILENGKMSFSDPELLMRLRCRERFESSRTDRRRGRVGTDLL